MAQTGEDAATMELKSGPFSETTSSISQEIEDVFSENGQDFFLGTCKGCGYGQIALHLMMLLPSEVAPRLHGVVGRPAKLVTRRLQRLPGSRKGVAVL